MPKEVEHSEIDDLVKAISSGGKVLGRLREFADGLVSLEEIGDFVARVDPDAVIGALEAEQKTPEAETDKPDADKLQYVLKILDCNCPQCGAPHENNYKQEGFNAACQHCGTGLESNIVMVIDPEKGKIMPGKSFGMDDEEELPVEAEVPEGFRRVGYIKYGRMQIPVDESKETGLIHPGKSVSWLTERTKREKLVINSGHMVQSLAVVKEVKLWDESDPYRREPYEYGVGSVVTEKIGLETVSVKQTDIILHPGIVGDLTMGGISHRMVNLYFEDKGEKVVLGGSEEDRNSLIITGSMKSERGNHLTFETSGSNPVVIVAPGAELDFESLIAKTLVVGPGASVKAKVGRVDRLIEIQPDSGPGPIVVVGGAVAVRERIDKDVKWFNDSTREEMEAIFAPGIESNNEVDI